MIASVTFRRFRALREAHLPLGAFNLVVGPNGSGKTSLIDALLRLRSLSRLPLRDAVPDEARAISDGPEIRFAFSEPYSHIEAQLECENDTLCDFLAIAPIDESWPKLRAQLGRIRLHVFDHRAMAQPSVAREGGELTVSGSNLASVLARMKAERPEAFDSLIADLCRILPEYEGMVVVPGRTEGVWTFGLRLKGEVLPVDPSNLSQGTLYLLGLLCLAHDPAPPSLVCLEEIDRGFHPRMLREVRDVLYRLSHPESSGLKRPGVQVVATTHSPYILDLFRDVPEEVVISSKHGASASFSRLSELPGISEILASGGSLGDLWYTGLLGGVPDEGAGAP